MDLSGLGKAAETLAEVIKDATGIIIDPIKKIVNSEADLLVAKRQAKKQLAIESLNIVNRAKLRLLETEVRRQYNLENICQNAIDLLPEGAEPEKLNRDWLNYFFSVSQDVSEDEMKMVWGKILAEESNKTSSFSKITLDRIKVMTAEDCRKFQELCKRIIITKNNAIIIKIQIDKEFHLSYNYDFVDFLKMVDLGLVSKSEIAQILVPPNNYLEVVTVDGRKKIHFKQ